MSEVVTYKGKIKEIYEEVETIYEKVSNYCNDNNIKVENEEYILDMLYSDEFYDKIIRVGNKLFEVITKENLDEEYIFEVNENEDGSYTYLVKYYDGGCSFDEAIYKALTNITN